MDSGRTTGNGDATGAASGATTGGSVLAAAFDGIRVLDLTEGFSGALCTMVLGDNGAAVVRVVSGSPDDRHADDDLAGARQWHRSKRIVEIVPGTEEAAAACRALATEADVVVTTWDDSRLGSVGLTSADVASLNPAAVHCTIDGFGDHPELADLPPHEGVVQAAAGRLHDYGNIFQLGRPAFCAPPLAGFGAAQGALHGICAALHVRGATGRGQRIRTSLLKGLLPYDLGSWLQVQFPGPPMRAQSHPFLPYIPARAKDGTWIQFANWAPHLFWEEATALGLGHLRDDPAFASMPGAATEEAGHAFWEQVLLATASRTADEWMAMLRETGRFGGDVIRHTSDGMRHPQALHNGDVVERDDPVVGCSSQIGPLVHVAGATPPIGVHEWDGAGDQRPGSATGAGPAGATSAGRGPLSDVVVLEAATMVATPLGPAMLSDLGARVIKIEPLDGDPGRTLGRTAYKMVQGKESIALDLKSPRGLEIVHRLVERADMFVHNYRPGVPERLGIDAASLLAVNPALVYLYAGAYGATGPYAKMPAYHPIAGAVCGNAARQVGEGALDGDGELPLDELKTRSLRLFRANEGHPDMVTGLVVATSLLLGLLARERDGQGRDMTTTMLAANAYLMSDDWIDFDGRPPRPVVDAELLGTSATNRLYETSDGWVFLAVPTQREWHALGELVGRELVDDERFVTPAQRASHDRELAEALAAALRVRSAADWEAAGRRHHLGIVRADRGGFGDFQAAAVAAGWAELARPSESAETGPYWRHAPMVAMDGVDGALGGASRNGEHTRAILGELGYDDDAIDELVGTGVVHAAEPLAEQAAAT